MAEKKASLTVLGGPLAGTRFVLEDAGPEVLLGSDPSCRFQLALTGVSPMHARLQMGPSGFTIEDAGSEKGLHVNDGKVSGPTPLRNGDIVWLGTPGEADVVMLQCILPARPVAAPAPEPPPPPVPDEDETLALALEQSEGAAVKAETIDSEATGLYSVAEEAAASVPFAAEEPTHGTELVVAEDETVVHGVPFVVDAPPAPPPAPAHFEDDTKEQSFVFEEESATVVMAHPEPVAPPAPSHDADFVAEEQATAFIPPDLEPTVIQSPPPTPPPPPRAERPAPPPAAAPPAPRPPRPAPAPAAAPARKPAPRPQPAPRAEEDDAEPRAASKGTSSTGLYAALGLAGLAVVAGGIFVVKKVMSGPPPTTLAAVVPPTAAPAPPRTTPPPVTEAPAPVETPVEVAPTPVTVPTPVAVVAPPTTTLKGAPTPLPTPTPATKKGPTPPPVTTPAGPSPEQVRAQQIANLFGQADSAVAAGQYDQAITHFDELLRLDPGNAKATADRASAASLRDASKKKFVAGRTVVKTEKASGGISGFEGADVQRTPDFSGRIDFEMSPASGLRPGDAWTLKVFLVNDGKKNIKVGGITASTSVNGSGGGAPMAAAVKEVAPQQRIPLGQIAGSWKDGTTSWSADVLVTANKGDSLKNTLTWR